MSWWPLLLLILSLEDGATAEAGPDDWTLCPASCKCKWMSGKKGAECSNSSLTSVPSGLSPEIQTLDLSGSTLRELPRSAFRSVGLVNLHKIFLHGCGIRELHKEAFHGLAILIELDLSGNHIRALHPGTFRDNIRLRVLNLNGNPIQKLEDGLFNNLTFLQTVELSGCRLSHVGRKTFVNVPNLKTLFLDGNNLTTMKVETLESLYVLGGLVLHNNPWHCDCHLQEFRDWTIARNLYAQPTACAEPPFLRGKLWSDLDSNDLACKPQILSPPLGGAFIEADGGNITLTCHVTGNPMPEVHWVFNSRIIGNYSRRMYGDQRYLVTESTAFTRWVNLTVTNVRSQDRGDYTCVAKSPGGVEERNITVAVRYSRSAGGRNGGLGDTWPLVAGLVSGLLILAAVILLFCFCFCRRRRRVNGRTKKMPSETSNGNIVGGGAPGNGSEQEKSLLTKVNPVQKPPRRHECATVTSPGTELTEMKCNLLDNGSVFLSGTSMIGSDDRLEDRSLDSLDTQPTIVPPGPPQVQEYLEENDVVGVEECEGGSSSAVMPATNQAVYPPDLLSFPPRANQVSPAGSSTASTAPDSTRLLAQQSLQSPVQSPTYPPQQQPSGSIPYSRSASHFSPVVIPRQGFVTIPRRPRVPSWSSSPSSNTTETMFKFEPLYDNLGPRTSADGSSVLSLNKTEQIPASIRGRPLPPTPTQSSYYPLEEQEVQQSPTLTRIGRGSLRRNNSLASAQSRSKDASLKRRDTGDYSATSKRNSYAGTLPISNRSSYVGSPTDSSPFVPLVGNLSNGQLQDCRDAKLPPLPPPKPKKKPVQTVVTGPLFEDEGEDGTEV